MESPKKMGPPEAENAEEGPGESGEVGEGLRVLGDGGRVSQERVRRQDCRTREKEMGASGS